MAFPSLLRPSSRVSSTFPNAAMTTSALHLEPASLSLSCRSPLPSPRNRPSEASARPRCENSVGPASSAIMTSLGRFIAMEGFQSGISSVASKCEDLAISISERSPTEQDTFLPLASPVFRLRGLPKSEQLGMLSTINIIVGKTVGVGAYAVPSAVFAGVGSVGASLSLWILGSIVSFCGLAVYLDLGTAIPKSGGERVYLERIFRRPHMLATCMFMAYVVLLGFSTPNAIVLGDYVLYALEKDPTEHQGMVRLVAVGAVTLLCYAHAQHPNLGLRLINILGCIKMLIIFAVIAAGFAGGMMGIGADQSSTTSQVTARRLDISFDDRMRSTAQRNFADVWAGSSTQPYDYATALLKVIYCFRGYGTANQVLSDIRNPTKTLRLAASTALILVSTAYIAMNVAFFLVVEKADFKTEGVVAAGVFFRNIFGPDVGTHVLPLFVIISAIGNIAATSFAQARVNEELARDGLLPWSKFWTSASQDHPSSAVFSDGTAVRDRSNSGPPSRGLLLHWAVSVAAILMPSGAAYAFLVDLGSYPISLISSAISFGLLYLHMNPKERWTSPCRANWACILVFATLNSLLLVLPWIAPSSRSHGGEEDGEAPELPYYAYPATAVGLLGLGAAYWCYWRLWGNGSTKTLENSGRFLPWNDDTIDADIAKNRLSESWQGVMTGPYIYSLESQRAQSRL